MYLMKSLIPSGQINVLKIYQSKITKYSVCCINFEFAEKQQNVVKCIDK